MKKYILIPIIIVSITILSFENTKAQQSLAILNECIYSTNYNPGKKINYKWHATIPGISNFNIAFSENLLTYNQLITSNETSILINPSRLIKNLRKPTRIIFDLNEELIGFGFKPDDDSYFSFSARLRSENYIFLPNELISMLITGNASYIGKNVESNLGIFHSTYLELGPNYQYTVNNNYTIGFRPKLLLGITNVHTRTSSINFLTTEEWDIYVNSNMEMSTYLPVDDQFDFKQDYFINSLLHNPGFAIDLGTQINLPYNLGIALSINDLGAIFWMSERLTNHFSFNTNDTGQWTKDGDLYFSGFEISLKGIETGEMQGFDEIFDSISVEDFIRYSYIRSESYRSPLYPKLYAELFYTLSNYRFSVLSRTDFVGKHVIPSVTFACNAYFGDIVELALSYSIYNRTFNNLGFGFHFHFGPVQWYCTLDNIISPIFPKTLNNISLQTGLFLGIRPKAKKTIVSSYI